MITPVPFDRIRPHLPAMSVLSQLGVRIRLQRDHVRAAAVLEAERLDVDAADPVVPVRVLLRVDVHVFSAELLGDLHLRELVVAYPVILPRFDAFRDLFGRGVPITFAVV